MRPINVRGTSIGEGIPKTIVSLMGKDGDELVAQAKAAVDAGANCLEWRVDFFGVFDKGEALEVAWDEILPEVLRAASNLRRSVPSTPIVFTFRSKAEGGRCELAVEDYRRLCKAAIESREIDLIDLELQKGDALIRGLIGLAHGRGLRAIVSYHDFCMTPETDAMVGLLVRMADLGADIPKLAVMAHSTVDTLRLMQAAATAHERMQKPLLAMAMGRTGVLSRLAGEAFGSCLTFCALGEASAPGQVELGQCAEVLRCLHESLAYEEP